MDESAPEVQRKSRQPQDKEYDDYRPQESAHDALHLCRDSHRLLPLR